MNDDFVDGFYSAEFSGPNGKGHGVVVLEKGTIRGGDSSMAYGGRYDETSNGIEGVLIVRRHAPGNPSVFGQDSVDAPITGRANGGSVTIDGPHGFRAVLSPIAL